MGNKNCVADGRTPHRIMIKLTNSTNFTWVLDCDAVCCSKCQRHRGFSAESGKFVQGHTPKERIGPGESIKTDVSGRESSAVVPDGWIQYKISESAENEIPCKIKISFSGAGWSSFQDKTLVECLIIGAPPFDPQSGEPMTRWVEKIDSQNYEVELKMGGDNRVKAGEDPVQWEKMVAAIFRPASFSRCKGLRVLISDHTPSAKASNKGLTVAWWLGATIGAFDIVVRACDDNGFMTAIAEVLKKLEPGDVIGELQFWCHGGAGGRVFCGKTEMEPAALAALKPFTQRHSRIWFRTCSTMADSDELEGCSPGPRATAWAEAVRQEGGFGVVAGHTLPIGNGRHTSLYALADGKWLGPQQDEGRPDDALHHYFGPLA